jgi:hypothetical protein
LPLFVGGEALVMHDVRALLDLMIEGLGIHSLDLDTRSARLDDLPDIVALCRTYNVEPSVLLDQERFRAEDLGSILRLNIGEVVLRPRRRAAAAELAALEALGAISIPRRLRLDLAGDDDFFDTWCRWAALARATHVLVGYGDGEPTPRSISSRALASNLRRLDDATVPWSAHGVPHCLLHRPERTFGDPQQGFDLYDYHPECEAILEKIAPLRGRSRLYQLELLYSRVDRRKTRGVLHAFETRLHELERLPHGRIPNAVALAVARRLPASKPSRLSEPDRTRRHYDEVCTPCSARAVCPGPTSQVRAQFGAAWLAPMVAHPASDAVGPAAGGRQVVPRIDEARVAGSSSDLVSWAISFTSDLSAAQEVRSSAYRVEKLSWDKMNGSIRWRVFRERLSLSSVLRVHRPPFAVRALFAGTASHVGFSVGGNAQVMCPMTADSHRLTFAISEQGRYVLLRDSQPVEPVDLRGRIHRSGCIPGPAELRLAAYGIHDSLITQEVLIWSGGDEVIDDPRVRGAQPVDLSVVVVCTRYSRRLQQLVRSIALQEGTDLGRVELLIAYVPGIDLTDDIVDSVRLVWPGLRVIPVRFAQSHGHAKGYMVNQAVARASGRRVLLTDADIIFPPDLFLRLDTHARDAHFVGIAGRKMLDKKTTSEILLGVRDPVQDFGALRDSPAVGEMRLREAKGMPCGFFQCVLRSHFEKVPYEELPHFEGADWRFAKNIQDTFGNAVVLEDTIVLHLDHSGSRWFGTDRHM